MCGIFGLWQRDNRPINGSVVQQATDTIRHRGPDDEGYLLFNTQSGQLIPCAGRATADELNLPPLDALQNQAFDLAFGFRRLAILDLSPAGHQPMSTPDGRYWTVFNGEIYNYIELRTELSALGHQFRSDSDTEVVLAAYAQWGAAMLNRFVGMFAFAILDRQERKLFLARDFFGIKPLYYTLGNRETAGQFAFASEIKALLALPDVCRKANPQRLYDYLRFGLTDHGAETMFANIRQLPAAHYLEVDLHSGVVHEPRQYWRLSPDQQLDISLDEATTQLRELFLDNVRLHLRSDVPVGACLSGGIDSSAIVMAMRHLEGSELDLHTFSAVFDDAVIGEEKYVDIVAKAAGSVVHKTQPSATELLADLDQLVTLQEEPFGSTSIYAQQRVFQLAGTAGIKVMLDGQGADEMLAGYRPYVSVHLAGLIRRGQWATAQRLFDNTARLPGSTKRSLLEGVARAILPPRWQAPFRQLTGKELMPDWLNQTWFRSHAVSFAQPPQPNGTGQGLRHTLHEALVHSSLPMLLRYEDRNSMSHSIESRVPFLTPALVQFVLSLPEAYLISEQGTSKAVLRRAMRNLVPDAILDRKDKIGFATPEQRWLNTLKPWVDETLQGAAQLGIDAINPAAAAREWEMVVTGARPFDRKIWRWLNAMRWIELYQVNLSA